MFTLSGLTTISHSFRSNGFASHLVQIRSEFLPKSRRNSFPRAFGFQNCGKGTMEFVTADISLTLLFQALFQEYVHIIQN
jgi:hypothetical protein